jgi:apolipoprotein D and lipocalin family protein
MRGVFAAFAVLLLVGCVGKPEKVTPVEGFELAKYLGKWYEIARLDHSFERGLQQVTAEYTLRKDGGIAVRNRGFSTQKKVWEEAVGKAYFVGDPGEGYLKVSFFGPFYGSYVIFELEQDGYQYAFVSGPSLGYLWLLARTQKLDPKIIARFIDKASALGFETDNLIFVEHQ